MKTVIAIVLGGMLVLAVRKRVLQVDISFPWFLAIVLLAFASLSEEFVGRLASLLGVVDAPFAIVLVTIFLILAICVFLSMTISRLRERQIRIVRHLASMELDRGEQARSSGRIS